MVCALAGGIALAQDGAPAAKTRKIGIHASGTVTLTSATCPEGTSKSDICYTISGTLKQGKEMGSVSGTIITNGTPTTTKNGTCYTLINTSTEDVGADGATFTASLTGEGCITTKKGKSTESLVGGAWESTTSEAPGSGKQTFKGTPTDPTSTTSPLAGSGIAHVTGSVTVTE